MMNKVKKLKGDLLRQHEKVYRWDRVKTASGRLTEVRIMERDQDQLGSGDFSTFVYFRYFATFCFALHGLDE
jgi:hypothetical protein